MISYLVHTHMEVIAMGYVHEVIRTMDTELNRIFTCLETLSEDQVWYRFKPTMNSIGNLCLHLVGNEYQHFVSGIGGNPNIRKRSMEFKSDGIYSKHEIKELLTKTRNESLSILQHITEADFDKPIRVNYTVDDWTSMQDRDQDTEAELGYTRDLQIILYQVCEHYAYHTGQIVILTKLLVDSEHSISGYKH
ncbi:DinB superfamily protein [compost metagenome]